MLGFVNALPDDPVFIHLQSIKHQGDEGFDALQLFAFLKGPLHEAGDAFLGDGAAVLGHALQPLLHLLTEAGFGEVELVGVGGFEVLLQLGGHGLHEHLEVFVAFDDIATGGGEFEGVGGEIDFSDDAAAESVGEGVVVFESEEVGLADTLAADAYVES